jgi:S1-C subfamily serine protease
VIGYAAAAGSCIFASPENVVNLADGFLQTRAFIDTGSSGGPVINADGDIVAVVSQGGGVGPGGVVELAKTRRLTFLRAAHEGLVGARDAAAAAAAEK